MQKYEIEYDYEDPGYVHYRVRFDEDLDQDDRAELWAEVCYDVSKSIQDHFSDSDMVLEVDQLADFGGWHTVTLP